MSNVCIIFVMTINSIRNESSKNCLIEITGCSSLRFWQRNRYGCQTSAHFRRNYQTLSDLTRPLCSFSFSDFSYQLIQLDQLIDTSDKELTSKCKTKIQSVSFLHFSCKQIFYCLHICLQSAHFVVHIFILQNLDTLKRTRKKFVLILQCVSQFVLISDFDKRKIIGFQADSVTDNVFFR